MNHGRLLQTVATKVRRGDADDGVCVCTGVWIPAELRKLYCANGRWEHCHTIKAWSLARTVDVLAVVIASILFVASITVCGGKSHAETL